MGVVAGGMEQGGRCGVSVRKEKRSAGMAEGCGGRWKACVDTQMEVVCGAIGYGI